MTRIVSAAVRLGYRVARGSSLPDDLPPEVILEVARQRAPEFARGQLHRRRYRESGKFHFRGPRTVVRNPHLLSVGEGVVFGSDVLVDSFSRAGIRLHSNVTVARGAVLLGSGVITQKGEGIEIGAHSAVGMNNVIWGQGGVRIGQDCLLGPNVTLVSENHGTAREQLIREQPSLRGGIEIGDDCWLGNNVTVVAGVSIGSGTVIGAGSVVTRAIPPYSVAVGIPARVVGERG